MHTDDVTHTMLCIDIISVTIMSYIAIISSLYYIARVVLTLIIVIGCLQYGNMCEFNLCV